MSELAAVFQIGSLGDSIVSIPSLLSIRELLPECSHYVLVTASYSKAKVAASDIFEMTWKPSFKVQYSGPENRLKQFLTAPSALARLRFLKPRYCISMMPADREPSRLARDRSFFKAAGVRELIGFEPYPESLFKQSSDVYLEGTESFLRFQRLWKERTTEKFQRYTGGSIMQPSEHATDRVADWLRIHRKHPEKRLIALCPYSNFPSRDFHDGTIAEIVSVLSNRADAEIVLVGGKKDFDQAAEILLTGGSGLNACGAFSVQESAALLQKCGLAICTESGPMHMAAALGIPLLAIFSRINKQLARWLPFGRQSTILYRDVPCAGCAAVHCPVNGHPCMTGITAEQIISAALDKLSDVPVNRDALGETRVLIW